MKKLIVPLIVAAAFSAGAAFAQPAATPSVADKSAAKEEKKAAPEKMTKAAKKPMTKEEKKAAFAERQAEMQKQSGAKFSTATPHKKKPKAVKVEKEMRSDAAKATTQRK